MVSIMILSMAGKTGKPTIIQGIATAPGSRNDVGDMSAFVLIKLPVDVNWPPSPALPAPAATCHVELYFKLGVRGTL